MSAQPRHGSLAVEAGTVFGFRTSPLFADSPPSTGRYGALVVLGHDDDIVVLGVLDAVWAAMPGLEEFAGRALLRQHRFFFTNQIAAFACGIDDAPTMAEFTEIGRVALTAEQQRLADRYLGGNRMGTSYGSPDGASSAAEGEWRWAHDREALLREHALTERRREQARAAAEHRYETRLKDLTWEQLIAERPFARWEPSPPFPAADFRDAATARIHDACRELQALGARPRKPAVRRIIADLVRWFNDADDRAGGVIETEEREDIWSVLEEMLHVAGQPSVIEEIDSWREW